MPNRLFLYLTQQQMIAFHWERGRCTLAKEFSIESAATDFVAYLRTHNKNLVSLVTNLAEEGFQLDTIPYLQSKDRAAVIKRKLEQFFIRAPLTVAISLGHEKTTRRNERMLFAALNNANALDPWLNAFRIAETRLVGIYSLPLLSPVLLEKLQIVNERCIFISLQDNSIRQTFFDKGSLNFSRLAPVADSSVSGLAQSVGSEIKKLQQYLLSQRLIGRNETLSAHVLIHSDALHALKNIVLPESIRLQTHPIEALAKKLGLKTEQQDSRAHVLFLQIAAQQTPRQQFAPIELRREYLLWKSSQVILTVSGIVLLICLLFASKQWSNLQEQQKRTLQQEMTAIEAENNYKKIVNTFPKLPVSQENLRQIINRYNEIQKNSPLPEQILKHLASALNDAPEIELTTLEWALSKEEDNDKSTKPHQETLQVVGTIRIGPAGTPRQLINVFEELLQKLRANAAYKISVNQQPFDTGSGASLKSGENAVNTTLPKPFSLTIVQKLTP